MRLAIDIQGIQSEGSRKRGIGRYSLAIVKKLISDNIEHEYILVANASLADLRSEFEDVLDSDNVIYFEWFTPSPTDYISNNEVTLSIGIYLRSFAFSCIHADLILITSFFEGFTDNCLIELDNDLLETPIISIFYDLIPLINPKLYLENNPQFESFYMSRLRKLKNVDGLLAISKSSASEAINYLEYNQNRIYNISSACDIEIFNRTRKCEYNFSFDIDKCTPFLLYSGAGDPRKNLERLIVAFGRLPENLNHYSLILVGKLFPQEIELIDKWIDMYGINPKKVVKTGYVSDDDLVELYRRCELFVFPSLHEGFGLPVLEAMSCGAPVIGSNRTSVTEIIALQSACFDPTNVEDISSLITKALTDPKFMNALRKNSQVQSSKFSWSFCSERVIDACLDIINQQPKNYDPSDWKQVSLRNKEKLDQLIDKLSKQNFLSTSFKSDFLYLVSACFDHIKSQTSHLYLAFSYNKNITSWLIEGPFDSNYSLAILNRCFAKSLAKYIPNTAINITEGNGDYDPNINFLKSYPEIFNLYQNSHDNHKSYEIVSRNLYPPRVRDLDSKINLIHTYGWEESGFPSHYVEEFNNFLSGITVMSKQVKKILIDNGVNIPIKVTGLGLDHLNDVNIDKELIIDANSYKILHISSCFPRKGIDILLRAYQKVFTINDDVSLIIKTFDNPHNEVEKLLRDLRDTNQVFPDVVLLKDEFNEKQLKSLFLQCDVLVAPSRGEGFGLPIGEAMLLGLPVITTNWGGQTDFCDSSNCWLIDYYFSPAQTHLSTDFSYWVEPFIDDLSNQLIKVFNSSDDEIKRKTIVAMEKIKKLTWDSVVENNLSFINEEIFFSSNKQTRVGWVSTWNTKCGIASYSKHLIDNMQDEIYLFTPFDENIEACQREKIIPSWNLKNTDIENFKLLESKIDLLGITSLVIQFNYGFYDFQSLSNFLQNLLKNDIRIIIFLHSTIDPINDESKRLEILSSVLKHCDRLIVHTINDMNRLKNISLVENVCLFPHGILDFEPLSKVEKEQSRFLFRKRKKLIGTYGFCLPNKGFKELIQAVYLLKNKGFYTNLIILAAIYNDDYLWFYEELSSLIKELHIEELVTIDTTYRDDDETLNLLSKQDLLVFPYQNSSESSSASVRHGLASMRPVLVTPSEIFSDLSSVLEHCAGFTSHDIADGILEFFENGPKVSKKLKTDIIKNRLFPKLASRLSALINSLEINKAIKD